MSFCGFCLVFFGFDFSALMVLSVNKLGVSSLLYKPSGRWTP
jgi:hypothetical protein